MPIPVSWLLISVLPPRTVHESIPSVKPWLSHARRPGQGEILGLQREVGIVCGIIPKEVSPAVEHALRLGTEPLPLRGGILGSPRSGFVMDERRERSPEVA